MKTANTPHPPSNDDGDGDGDGDDQDYFWGGMDHFCDHADGGEAKWKN